LLGARVEKKLGLQLTWTARTAVSQFKYLETAVANRNLIPEEIKTKLSFGNACYHLAHNLLSSWLLSKKCKNENLQDYNFACGSVWV
jgi:hypothetical protein